MRSLAKPMDEAVREQCGVVQSHRCAGTGAKLGGPRNKHVASSIDRRVVCSQLRPGSHRSRQEWC
jgi:hypothetical protein